MKTLLYLPIDIDVGIINFNRDDSLRKMPTHGFQPKWWDSAILDFQSFEKNNLLPIINQLPYDKITMAMHKFQTTTVEEHFDVYPQMKISAEELQDIKDSEPCGYRIVIKGRNDVLEVWNGKEWLCPILPESPCCYLINTTSLKHRVKDDPGREIIYFRGILNKEKHRDLINRSLNRYKDQAIYLK
jgi:hypothetical protein